MFATIDRRIRVALLDDHAAVRHGLETRLAQEADIDVVGAYSGSQQLIDALQNDPADLLLIDYALGHNDIDGHNLIRLLCIRFPRARIIVTSAHDNQATVAMAMRAGANGFVGKGQALDELVAAVRAVMRGDTYLSPAMAAELGTKAWQQKIDRTTQTAQTEDGAAPDAAAGNVGRSATAVRVAAAGNTASAAAAADTDAGILQGNRDLTPREREVLRCYLSGMSVAQIAEKFSRSNKTISTQKQAGYRKLGIRSDAELFQIRYQLDTL